MNLTELLKGFNLTNIFGEKNNTADTGNPSQGDNSESNWWDSIFGKKDSGDNIIDNQQ